MNSVRNSIGISVSYEPYVRPLHVSRKEWMRPRQSFAAPRTYYLTESFIVGEWMTQQQPTVFSRSITLGFVLTSLLLLAAVACGTDTETPDLPAPSPAASPTSVAATPDIVADAGVLPAASTARTSTVDPTVIVAPDLSTVTPGATATRQPAATSSSAQSQPVAATAAPTQTPPPTATAVPTLKVGYKVGERAPDFTLHAVTGETYTLSDIVASGKPVLLYFFASW